MPNISLMVIKMWVPLANVPRMRRRVNFFVIDHRTLFDQFMDKESNIRKYIFLGFHDGEIGVERCVGPTPVSFSNFIIALQKPFFFSYSHNLFFFPLSFLSLISDDHFLLKYSFMERTLIKYFTTKGHEHVINDSKALSD